MTIQDLINEEKQNMVITSLFKPTAERIQETTKDGCPSGVLYAALSAFRPLHYLQNGICEKIIAAFKSCGKIVEKNYVIYWVAGKKIPEVRTIIDKIIAMKNEQI